MIVPELHEPGSNFGTQPPPPQTTPGTRGRRRVHLATSRPSWPSRLLGCEMNGQASAGRSCLLGLSFVPLFRLDPVRRQEEPLPDDRDRARYVLCRCSGGYPMGVFSMGVRGRIEEEGDREPTQWFFMVSFDFFGREHWLGTRAVRALREPVHDRMTSGVLNRFQAHCQEALARRRAA